MAGEDNIFPLLNRRAPLLDRIREDNDQDQLTDLVSNLISDSVKSDDDELIQETKERITEDITTKLADDFGVKETDISPDFIDDLSQMLVDADEVDVLTDEAAERLGIKPADDKESKEEDENPLFDDE